MNIWILTIGSSDVQLDSNTQSQDKGRTTKSFSDQIWNYWYTDELKANHYLPNSAKPTRSFADKDETYWVSPRILGLVYKASPDTVQRELLVYLTFPLLDNFVSKLKDMNAEDSEKYPLPAVIALLLTDQFAILTDTQQRRNLKSPYWKDTCELYPILEDYLGHQFPDAIVEPLLLQPKFSEPGLDNWDAVLELVQQEIERLKFETEPQTVYVSHQAGTPAISSAVQFCSLAKFGDRVRFLVSNEHDAQLTGFVESSSYLRGIEIQQAKKLLENHDYSGIKEVLKKQIEEANKPKNNPKLEDEILKHISYLLDAAIQWNFAKFEGFATVLKTYPDQTLVKQRQAYLEDDELAQCYLDNAKLAKAYLEDLAQYWWWIGYEAAYLALIRLDQKNAVEAFFHSFRAVEGLISRWTEVTYPEHVDSNNDSPQVKLSILEELPDYLSNKKQEHLLSEFKEKQKLGLHSFPLYDLLRKGKPDWRQKCKDISVFTDQIAPKRNKLFHRLKGLEVLDVLQEWKVNDVEELEVRIRHYLNFISNQSFNSLEAASLMAQVHEELEKAIEAL